MARAPKGKSPTDRDGPVGASITRRGAVILGAQGLLAAGLAWRMRQLQVIETDHYRLLAEENRINLRLIAPARAEIFDRNGVPLAINRQNYRVVMIREQAGDPEEMLDKLGQIIDIPDHQRRRVLKEITSKSAFVPVSVSEHLSWEDFAAINVNAPALPGIQPEVGLSRWYPHGAETAHVVGYVGRVTQKDLDTQKEPDPILQVPEFQIGKSGVERAVEMDLRGTAGTRRIEVNALGRVIRELDRVEGAEGKDLHLTIDLGLQAYAHKRLGEESAAVAVMDVNSGDLLALASNPTFDPNLFVLGISQKDYGQLLNNDHRPLHNKWASGMYPPGSTFKMVVALAAMELGVISPRETVFCNGSYKLGNRRFHCWKRGGHGHVNMTRSLEESCDVYFYDVARQVGIDNIAEMARKLGLGMPHELPMPVIKDGLMPTRAWKKQAREESWQQGDTLNSGIGQGFVLATPLQLAVMTARLASGKAVTPRLVRAQDGVPMPVEEAPLLDISLRSLDVVRKGMFDVMNAGRGTARRSRIADEANLMAGKTGTSQVRNITAAERARGVFRNEDLPWNRRDHALFVGYAPYDAPRFAVAVVVEHGGGGSKAAAPVARDLLMYALYGPEPPLEAYPLGQRPERPPPPATEPAPRPAGSGGRVRT
ncbi:MAG: penicillin-binding protein 2 [Pseudomonadota bacterium]